MNINQLKNKLQFENILLQTISVPGKLYNTKISLLRLDRLHEQISGNKWFKLQYFLLDFFTSEKEALATFGGAYSNHIAASAAACRLLSVPSIGYIRGEEPKTFSPTLTLAKENGMGLRFVSREQYKDKEKIMFETPQYYWIPEGGYGVLGAKGAADIWNYVPEKDQYTHVFLAVGSGTTIAGLLNGAAAHQHIVGVSVMKNNFSLQNEIAQLTQPDKIGTLSLLHDYHFGGYAKKTDPLLDFIASVEVQYNVPLDFVYTGKAFFALMDQLKKGNLPSDSRILFVHTGGLQGNQSLLPAII